MKFYTMILKDAPIPAGDFTLVLRRSLSCEPLKIIESVPDDCLDDFGYLKQRTEQHCSLTESGQRGKFRNLTPMSTQTFLDFSAKVQLVPGHWLEVAKVTSFQI